MADRASNAVGTGNRLIGQGIAITCIILVLPAFFLQFSWLYGLVPLPAFYLVNRLGIRKGSAVLGVAIVLAGIITGLLGVLPSMIFGLGLMPAGFSLARSVTLGETPRKAGLKAILVVLLLWSALWLVSALMHGINPYQESIKSLDRNMATWYEIYAKSSQAQTSGGKELEIAVIELRNLIPKVFPALMLMSVCLTIWLNMLAGQWLFNKGAAGKSPWPSYREWELPDHLVWGVVAGVAGMILPNEAVQTLALNLLLVLGTLFFFQGLALLSHLLEKWKIPGLLRGLVYLLICIQVFGLIFLSLMGLLETWLDIRTRKPEDNNNADQAPF